MDFYYNELSGPCRSVMLTAKALGITLKKKRFDLMKKEQINPEFIAINPQHCVPTLVDSDFALWESRPICTYLIAKYAKDDSLYPQDPQTRAQIDRLLYFDRGTLYKRFGDYVYPILFGNDKADATKLELLHDALGWFEGFLKGHDFCVGDSMTVADFVLIASVSTFQESGIDLSKYPSVSAWIARCKARMVGYDTENDVGAKQFGAFVKSKMN